MFVRTLERKLKQVARRFPVVFLTGPRQSGKTTLARHAFPRFQYVSLEDLDEREFAASDPRGFIARFSPARGRARGVILDEAQRVPSLFSYLQTFVDAEPRCTWIVTGSQQFQLAARISQTLAGRVAILQLYPLSLAELMGRVSIDPTCLDRDKHVDHPHLERDELLFSGMYPRIHDRKLDPRDWINGYVRTYVERDVRELLAVGDLETFGRFVRLTAGRSGQLLNLSSLGSDVGVAQPTARRWLSVLEASGLLFLLRPHHANFTKQLVKSPKLYFLDSGLMCFLLGIRSTRDLMGHPLHGAIFETFVVSELYKAFAHCGELPPLHFWRDRTGTEVDVIVDLGRRVVPIEIKLAQTVRSESLHGLDRYVGLSGAVGGVLIHGGSMEPYRRARYVVRPWWACS